MYEAWAGSEESHQQVTAAIQQAAELQVARGGSMDSMQMPSLLEVVDGVGVISITGPLVSGSAGWMRFFGVTGYNDIRDAMVQAAEDSKVKSILLDINSPGGAVAGIEDTTQFIQLVSQLKPVVAYTAGNMLSGGYWLASAASRIITSGTSLVGSIGVIMTLSEYSGARKQAGITDTVIRAGKYKALGGPYETLTPEAKSHYETLAQDIYTVFLNQVAASRKVSVQRADDTMAQGREFVGAQAVKVGLVDKLGSFEDAVQYAQSLVNVDKNKPVGQNPRQAQGASMKTLSAEQLQKVTQIRAAVAAGAQVSAEDQALLAAATETTTETAQPTAEEQAAAQAAADAAAAAATAAAAAAAATPAAKESELVTFLKSELATANAKIVSTEVELTQVKAQLQDVKVTHDGLLEIARGSVSNMQIALGGNGTAAKVLGAVELLAEHKRVSELFVSKFPIGGVASTSTNTPAAEKKAPPAGFLALVSSQQVKSK